MKTTTPAQGKDTIITLTALIVAAQNSLAEVENANAQTLSAFGAHLHALPSAVKGRFKKLATTARTNTRYTQNLLKQALLAIAEHHIAALKSTIDGQVDAKILTDDRDISITLAANDQTDVLH